MILFWKKKKNVLFQKDIKILKKRIIVIFFENHNISMICFLFLYQKAYHDLILMIKKFKLLKYEDIIYHFKARDLEILNM